MEFLLHQKQAILPLILIYAVLCRGAFYTKNSSWQEENNNFNEFPAQLKDRNSRIIDNHGKYFMEWTVDHNAKIIQLNLIVETSGWVGVGFSQKGEMKEADILVAGVASTGQFYLKDLHSDLKRNISTDTQQNWQMMSVVESGGVTSLKVFRALDTCDPFDYPITMDLVSAIWAYGETDEFNYHLDKRGSFRVYFLDPVMTAPEKDITLWRPSMQLTLPPKQTSYWCKILKGPQLPTKHHIVRTGVFQPNEVPVKHTHHLFLWRCVVPPGTNAAQIFKPFLEHPVVSCGMGDWWQRPQSTCFYWTGIPIGESMEEYYMLEVHFDNPEKVPGIPIEAGMNIYYRKHLRKNEGHQMMLTAYDNLGVLMIPPVSQNFQTLGFCSTECTREMLTSDGVEIITVMLHSHNSGQRMKLHHFRNLVELPWVMHDDNYDNTFQQQRILRQPRLLLPGDLLVCVYDNTWYNITTVAGKSTREEMCSALVYINKRIPYTTCNSLVSEENLLGLIGLKKVKWDIPSELRVVSQPSSQRGKFLAQVTDWEVNWTKALRQRLQEETIKSVSIGSCPKILLPNAFSVTPHDMFSKQLEKAVATFKVEVSDAMQHDVHPKEKTVLGNAMDLPTRTPGPASRTSYPFHVSPYQEQRICPEARITSAAPYLS